MQIALITDSHFGIKNDVSYILDYQEKFYNDIFFPKLKEMNISTVFHLGDLFDRRKYININTLDRTRSMFLDKIGNMYSDDYKVYVIAGNHDVYNKSSNDVNSLRHFLQGYSNITVIDNAPLTLKCDSKEFLFIPWINNSNYETIMKAVKASKADILCGHLELSGFDMYKGMPNEHGMAKEIFSKFDKVLTGHFHTKSIKDNIHYLGAPMEFTFADCEDDRGFHIYDTETNTLEFIKNPYTLHEKIYYYDDTKERQNYFTNFDEKILENKIVKLYVCKKTKIGVYESLIDRILSVNTLNLSIMEDYSEFESSNVNVENVGALTTKDLMDEYITAIDTELDKDRLKNIINKIYVDALHTEV